MSGVRLALISLFLFLLSLIPVALPSPPPISQSPIFCCLTLSPSELSRLSLTTCLRTSSTIPTILEGLPHHPLLPPGCLAIATLWECYNYTLQQLSSPNTYIENLFHLIWFTPLAPFPLSADTHINKSHFIHTYSWIVLTHWETMRTETFQCLYFRFGQLFAQGTDTRQSSH